MVIAVVVLLLTASAAWAQVEPDEPEQDEPEPAQDEPEPAHDEPEPAPPMAPVAEPAAEPVAEPAAEPALEPDAVGDTEEDDEVPAAGQTPVDSVIEGAVAPATLSSYLIQGRVIDSLETLRGFLDPVVHENESWKDEDQRNVIDFLETIGYHTSIRNEQLPHGGVRAVLVLEPVTLVRYVDVDVKIGLVKGLVEPVFGDNLLRRMTLRPGSALELGKRKRAEQLREEADRLAEYLQAEGFFEARVTIRDTPAGQFARKLTVSVYPGPAYSLGQVRVTGNNTINDKDIRRVFDHSFLGIFEPRFTRQRLNRDIERLVKMYQKRGFPGVRVSTDFDMRHSFNRETKTVEFTVKIRERRKIDVVFEGNRHADAADLTDELTLSAEGSYDDVEVESSADAIRRYYQSRGYFEANVTTERVRFGVFERIVFSVEEGPRLEIEEVRFSGNQAISSDELRSTVKTRKFERLIIGESGGFATSLQLRQDVDRIEQLYRDHGYRAVEVGVRVARTRALLENAAALSAAVIGGAEADGLYVVFEIDEGPQYIVEQVRFHFEGYTRLTEADLMRVIKQTPGTPFRENAVVRDKELLRRHYFAKGFPRATVQAPQLETGTAEDRVIITHKIRPNSAAVIGKIAIRGNFKTRDWVILDEMKLEEGMPLTVFAAERALSNLRRSGLFSAVQINYMGFENQSQRVVNVLVRVEERHDNWFGWEVGGGYSSDEKGFVETAITVDNILGTGMRLDTRGVLGQEERSLEGKLVFPHWVMRKVTRTSLLVELAGFYRVENTERFGDLTSIGGSLAATKEGRRGFWRGWLLSMRYDFRQRNRDEELVRGSGPSDGLVRSKVTSRSSTIGPLLSIDKRRDAQGRLNPLTPSKGIRLTLRASFGEDFALGTDRFIKLGAAGQHFLSLGDRFLISNGLRYDHGIPLSGDVVLPEVERFFAGGDTTVRGYEEDRLATEVIEDQLAPLGGVNQFRVIPAGGNIRFIHNLDLQVRVWDRPPGIKFPIASAIFFDTGLVENSLDGFTVTDLRHSIGIALARLVTPFGSLSVEYAIPLDPQLGDDPRGRFHVNFGFLF